MDKYHGQGGSYEIDEKTRERVLKDERRPPEPAGGGARDKDGRPLAKPVDTTEEALPKPGPAPWASSAAKAPAAEPGAEQAKRKGV